MVCAWYIYHLPIPAPGAPPCGGGDIRFGFGVPGVGGFCGPTIGRIDWPAPVGPSPGAGDVIGPWPWDAGDL